MCMYLTRCSVLFPPCYVSQLLQLVLPKSRDKKTTEGERKTFVGDHLKSKMTGFINMSMLTRQYLDPTSTCVSIVVYSYDCFVSPL